LIHIKRIVYVVNTPYAKASFIGLVVHAFYAVTFGPLYYRDLERNKISALNFNNGDFDSETNISLESENEITWLSIMSPKKTIRLQGIKTDFLKLILNPRSSSFCTIVSVFCAQMSKF
jgi:hypothetical protein